MTEHRDKPIVIALGGNAIARAGDDGSIAAQYRRAAEAMRAVADVVCAGHPLVLTHGNGPVVGNIVLRSEIASASVPPMPLFIAGADSEGGIGLMLQQTLHNELVVRGCTRSVATVVTQVTVDPKDEAFTHPTKPIGSSWSREEAIRMRSAHGWTMAEQPDGRFRRVVASPLPLRVVEVEFVRSALEADAIPIACGGGGVPVTEDARGELTGVDAVIDKDWASAVLAEALGAQLLIILMEADRVYLDWNTPDQRPLVSLHPSQASGLLAEGAFAAGSIAPKVAAAASFVEATGGRAILCATEDLAAALAGRAGTTVHR